MRVLSVVFLISLSLAGCRGNNSPVAPSVPEELVRPPANPSQYLQIPTDRIYLLTETGVKTNMWFRILQMTPAPGSEIKALPIDCQRNCFYLTVELGGDVVANPNIYSRFIIGFGAEEGNRQNLLVQGGTPNGIPTSLTTGPRSFDNTGENVGIPKYLVIEGKTIDDSSGHIVDVFGKKSLSLGYRPM